MLIDAAMSGLLSTAEARTAEEMQMSAAGGGTAPPLRAGYTATVQAAVETFNVPFTEAQESLLFGDVKRAYQLFVSLLSGFTSSDSCLCNTQTTGHQ